MHLQINKSLIMSSGESALGSIEDRLIRIPENIRKMNNLIVGTFLSCVDNQNKKINLKVFPAYKEDVIKNPDVVWVSKSTYNIIKTHAMHKIIPADKILIGCDPEFFIVNTKTQKTVSATHFFSHYGEVGSDCGLAELRPRPSFNEQELTLIMKELFIKAVYKIANRKLYSTEPLNLIAASYHNSNAAGFHIHFGLPNFILAADEYTYVILSYIVCILDYYIGLPAILPEGNEDNIRRTVNSSHYGKPADYRYDTMTLEYRFPGGHLLRHPVLTSGILAIAKTVMNDILSRLKVVTNNFSRQFKFKQYDSLRDFYPNLPDRKELCDVLTSKDILPATRYINKIFEDISQMVGYEESRLSITQYFEYVSKYLLGRMKYSENIISNWRIMDYAV